MVENMNFLYILIFMQYDYLKLEIDGLGFKSISLGARFQARILI